MAYSEFDETYQSPGQGNALLRSSRRVMWDFKGFRFTFVPKGFAYTPVPRLQRILFTAQIPLYSFTSIIRRHVFGDIHI